MLIILSNHSNWAQSFPITTENLLKLNWDFFLVVALTAIKCLPNHTNKQTKSKRVTMQDYKELITGCRVSTFQESSTAAKLSAKTKRETLKPSPAAAKGLCLWSRKITFNHWFLKLLTDVCNNMHLTHSVKQWRFTAVHPTEDSEHKTAA